MKNRGWLTRGLTAAALTSMLVAHSWGALKLPFVNLLDNAIYDARIRAYTAPDTPPPVVILNIDEASIAQLGNWPWPRDTIARVVDVLFNDFGIRTLGFDFLLTEVSDDSALRLLDALDADPRFKQAGLDTVLQEQRQRWDLNTQLGGALQDRNIVMGYVFKDYVAQGSPIGSGVLPAAASAGVQQDSANLPLIKAAGYMGVPAHYLATGAGAGYLSNPSTDADGTVRRLPLLMAFDGQLYESFALGVVRSALGAAPLELAFDGAAESEKTTAHFSGLRIGERLIPLDERLNALIPYRGRLGSFSYISVIDVLQGKVAFETLFDKVVLIGTTATGLPDLHSTPVGGRFAGVEIHANLIAGMMEGTIKASPLYLRGLELLSLVATALLVTLISVLPLSLAVLIFAMGGLGVHYASALAWNELNLDLPLGSVITLAITLFILQSLISFARESLKRNQLAKVFGQYVPKDVAKRLNKNTSSLSMEGQSREMSVLFTDVRGFTSISEGVPPQELTQLMNAFLTPMTAAIHHHYGTIDKYMGDAIMAFWGAPLDDRRHANNAVEAGLKMLSALQALAPTFKARGWPLLQIGIGINSGTMHVGNMGSSFRVAYTVLGDAVNLGARLESLTKQYGLQFLVSESTAELATWFTYREIDTVRVKGKDTPVKIYEPLGKKSKLNGAQREQLKFWDQALADYRLQRWPSARALLETLHAAEPGFEPYAIYLGRIAQFEQTPPPADWDGVFSHLSK
jgi:adenylate cyclase